MGDKLKKCKFDELFDLFPNCDELCITLGSAKLNERSVLFQTIVKNGLELMRVLNDER